MGDGGLSFLFLFPEVLLKSSCCCCLRCWDSQQGRGLRSQDPLPPCPAIPGGLGLCLQPALTPQLRRDIPGAVPDPKPSLPSGSFPSPQLHLQKEKSTRKYKTSAAKSSGRPLPLPQISIPGICREHDPKSLLAGNPPPSPQPEPENRCSPQC